MGTQTNLKDLATSAKSSRDNVVDGNASSISASMSPKTAYSKNITIEEWNQLVANSTAILQNASKERDFSTAIYNWVSYLNSLPYISNVSVAVASGTSSQYLSVSRADTTSADNNSKASTFTLTFDDTVLNTQFDTLRSNLATLSETVTTAYLTKAEAYSTYLTKADAIASYLSKTEAASTYATIGALDECLKLDAGNIVYSQSQNRFSINGPLNYGQFAFDVNSEDFTIVTGDAMTLTINIDFVERDAGGVITHLDWTDIETKSHAASIYAPQATTYTKAEVNNLISGLHSLSFSVVSELPATGSSDVIYLVPKDGSAPDIYDEYVWLSTSQSYEKLGSTDIDLSGYLKTHAGSLAYQQDTTAFRVWNGDSGYITLKPSSGSNKSSIFLSNATNSANKVYFTTDGIEYTVDVGANWTTLTFSNIETKTNTANTYVPKTRTVNNKALSADITLDKSDVGLGNVDNTSDLAKPISTATQTALNAKQDTLVSGTNIKTVNGESVLGSGNIAIEVESITNAEIEELFAEGRTVTLNCGTEYRENYNYTKGSVHVYDSTYADRSSSNLIFSQDSIDLSAYPATLTVKSGYCTVIIDTTGSFMGSYITSSDFTVSEDMTYGISKEFVVDKNGAIEFGAYDWDD